MKLRDIPVSMGIKYALAAVLAIIASDYACRTLMPAPKQPVLTETQQVRMNNQAEMRQHVDGLVEALRVFRDRHGYLPQSLTQMSQIDTECADRLKFIRDSGVRIQVSKLSSIDKVRPSNTLRVIMTFQALQPDQVKKYWIVAYDNEAKFVYGLDGKLYERWVYLDDAQDPSPRY